MLSVLLYFLFQPAHAVEYTCTQVHHLNRPLEHLAAGFLEQSLDWEVINTVNPWILNSRLKLNLIKNETGTLTSYLKFNVKKNQYQIPLNSLTLSKSAVHELKYAAASGMMTMDPFQKNVVSLHERYQFSIDSLAEYETTPEERALMSLRKLNIPDPTILTDYLNSEDGRSFVLDQAKRFQAIIESKAHFARIAVNDDVIFPLLGQGFKV
ncbi:MAG: hypothetical protein ACXVA9_12905, partial [Bdellovibrionales bacterium]